MAANLKMVEQAFKRSRRDGRRAARQKVLERAQFWVGKSQMQSYPCILKDMSETGCQVVGSSVELIGNAFKLNTATFSTPRACRVVWRKKRVVGAIFVDPAPAPADLDHEET